MLMIVRIEESKDSKPPRETGMCVRGTLQTLHTDEACAIHPWSTSDIERILRFTQCGDSFTVVDMQGRSTNFARRELYEMMSTSYLKMMAERIYFVVGHEVEISTKM
ncbi:hypothetical protein KAR91_22155 [Candidatus Pacearchaeota archaeon]|nr:hypothetical protein [Candidatus Pacearchaeota archaeon]